MTDLNKLLDQEFYAHDRGADLTVRQYLADMLMNLLQEGEGFSGKRPFGNSGWEDFLLVPAIESGYIKGRIDRGDPDYPEPFDFDDEEYMSARRDVVAHVFGVKF